MKTPETPEQIEIRSEGGSFPALVVTQKNQSNGIDLNVSDEHGNNIGTVALDYFAGQLRIFIWQPSDQEPSQTISIKSFEPAGEGK